MSDGGYKIHNQAAIHFITFAVSEWVDVFTRKEYRDIVLESIRFCQKEKGLLLHSWCIMSNHLHLIVSAKNENLSDVLRDFKKFTSKQVISAIENNPKESRKVIAQHTTKAAQRFREDQQGRRIVFYCKNFLTGFNLLFSSL